jgi:hypothetical protein
MERSNIPRQASSPKGARFRAGAEPGGRDKGQLLVSTRRPALDTHLSASTSADLELRPKTALVGFLRPSRVPDSKAKDMLTDWPRYPTLSEVV